MASACSIVWPSNLLLKSFRSARYICPMTATEAILDSWTRQCKAWDNLLGRLTPELLAAKPSPDGWNIAFHIAHLHGVRRFWHANATGRETPVGTTLYQNTDKDWAEWTGCTDIAEMRTRLKES